MSVAWFFEGTGRKVLLVRIANLLLRRARGYVEYLIYAYQAREGGIM